MPLVECRCGAANEVPYDSVIRCSLCGRSQSMSRPVAVEDGRPVTMRTGLTDVQWRQDSRTRQLLVVTQPLRFSRVGDPAEWSPTPEDDLVYREKQRWEKPDFWLHEKELSPARKLRIPGVRQDRKKFTRFVVRHDDLGNICTHMRGKETFVWREIITMNDGSKLRIDIGSKELSGCSDPIKYRMDNLRRFLEKRQIDLQPYIDAQGL